LRALRKRKPQETLCVGKQPIIVAIASTEHFYWLALAFVASLPTQALAFLAVFVYETHATQAIAYEWKPGLRLLILLISTPIKPQNPNANLCWPRVLTVPTKIEAVCMYVCMYV